MFERRKDLLAHPPVTFLMMDSKQQSSAAAILEVEKKSKVLTITFPAAGGRLIMRSFA